MESKTSGDIILFLEFFETSALLLRVVSLQPYQHQLMIEAAQQYLDTSRRHKRVIWAKQAHVAKGMEKMAYERKLPFESRVAAREILDGMF